jgi:hypothetical protein
MLLKAHFKCKQQYNFHKIHQMQDNKIFRKNLRYIIKD